MRLALLLDLRQFRVRHAGIRVQGQPELFRRRFAQVDRAAAIIDGVESVRVEFDFLRPVFPFGDEADRKIGVDGRGDGLAAGDAGYALKQEWI